MVKISVIIPVHNGENVLRKTVVKILQQSIKEIEIILVENFSKDNSYKICCELSEMDSRVKALKSMERGTSLARKKGVENASGEYIVFSDQDDSYINKYALENMLKAISDDGTDICQFGHYINYCGIYKKKVCVSEEKLIINKNELFTKIGGGVIGYKDDPFTTTIWDKIYRANSLKNAIKDLTESMYFAEDMYLNVCAFTSDLLSKVSVRPELYYVWNSGIGFSSRKDSVLALMKDYEFVKQFALKRIHNINDDYIFNMHLESLYIIKATVDSKLSEKDSDDEILRFIAECNEFQFVRDAKTFMNNYVGEKHIWDELRFLASDYSPVSMYEYCKDNLDKKTKKNMIKSIVKKIL